MIIFWRKIYTMIDAQASLVNESEIHGYLKRQKQFLKTNVLNALISYHSHGRSINMILRKFSRKVFLSSLILPQKLRILINDGADTFNIINMKYVQFELAIP